MKRRQFQVHALADPALTSMTGAQAVEYAMSRQASDLPPLADEAVVFTYRRMTRSQRYFVEGATSEVERHDRAFMAAIIKIEGGHFGEAWVPDAVDDPQRAAMSVQELDYLLEGSETSDPRLSGAEVSDVGMVCYVRSMLLPKAEPRFPRPRTSLAAWDALYRPSAEPTREDAPPNNEALKAV